MTPGELLRAMDKDGDQGITFAEFRRFMRGAQSGGRIGNRPKGDQALVRRKKSRPKAEAKPKRKFEDDPSTPGGPEKWKQIRDLFNRLDKDGDGRLTKKALEKMSEAYYQKTGNYFIEELTGDPNSNFVTRAQWNRWFQRNQSRAERMRAWAKFAAKKRKKRN